MEDGLKVISDKEAIKVKIEDCIKKARVEKAFDILEENAECFNASKEDIHLARANYVKAEKDNELGLSDREEVSRVRSRSIRFIQRAIKGKRTSGVIGNIRFWIIVISVILIIPLLYLSKAYIFTGTKSNTKNTTSVLTLNEENLEEYFRKLKDPIVKIAEKNELIDRILYQYEGINYTVERREVNDTFIDSQPLSYVLKQLKFGDYGGYIIKSLNDRTIIIKRVK